MKFIIITGPQAVGKMAVGMAVAEKTGMRLFHNHMSIELAIDMHGTFNKEARVLNGQIREAVFESVLSDKGHPGFLFTYVWDFDDPKEFEGIDDLFKKFESRGWETCIVELEADLETRIERNTSPLRLEKKASKRNTKWSHGELVSSMDKHRLNSKAGEIKHGNYMRINNNALSAEDVALKIIEGFNLLVNP